MSIPKHLQENYVFPIGPGDLKPSNTLYVFNDVI